MDFHLIQSHQLSIGLCFLLGALHALEPGHGKTALAAHVLSEKGIFRPAVVALSTAISHSISILIVAALVHGTLDLAFQESHGLGFYRTLNLASGALLCAVGAWLFYNHKRNKNFAPVHRGNCCGSHKYPAKENLPTISLSLGKQVGKRLEKPAFSIIEPVQKKSTWNTILIGFAVGLIPCPTALVALSQALVAKDWTTVAVVTFTFAAGIFTSLFLVGSFLGLKIAPQLLAKTSSSKSFSKRSFGFAQALVILLTGTWHLYLGL